jgi:hypothetical protein
MVKIFDVIFAITCYSEYQEEADGSTGPSTESSNSNTPEIAHDRKVGAHRVSNETLTSDNVTPQPRSPTSLSPMHRYALW